jgi:dipeptidyl aminopeptidase/acylaminoacyl peptidase
MNRAPVRLLSVFFLFGASSSSGAKPATAVEALYDSLSSVHEFLQVAVSPDGRRVAWVVEDPPKRGLASRSSAVWVADLGQAPRPRRVTAGTTGRPCREGDVAFSPDGKSLAFVSKCGEDGKEALWVVGSVAGGDPKRVPSGAGVHGHPKWMPDGRSLAFLFIENARKQAGALVPTARDAGLVDAKIDESRIAVAELPTGRVRLVSPADTYVYEFDVAPDGKSFVATAAKGDGDDNWWIASLVTVDVATGKTMEILRPGFQMANPRFSPDGRSVAFIGGLMSDFGATGGDLYTVPASGGEPRNLTPGRESSPAWLTWLSSGRILYVENVAGDTAVVSLDPGSGASATLWKKREMVCVARGAGLAVSKDGQTTAAIHSSFSSPPEIWVGPVGSWAPVTKENAALTPAWGEVESLTWESDSHPVQGWLLPPRDPSLARKNGKAPLVVMVHGGPSSAHTARWPRELAGTLAGRGSYVFLPNPRGSYGMGEAFTRGNVKDFGYGDLRDILAGVEEIVRTRPVDTERVGVTGWSYGGYMTMWTVTQTNRFAAAVAGAGIANWQSYYGQNRIDQWMVPFFGASVYEDPAIYARSSPMTFIRSAKTPTLVLHGERDAEVPAPQGYEFWHALKTLGVPTQLVIYPDEGHAIRMREHDRDRVVRSVAWFERFLGGPESPPPALLPDPR